MHDCIKHYPSLLVHKTAVALVAHGLNLKPSAMLPLINWLVSRGADVYLVQLSGHHTAGTAIHDVKASTWQQEMLTGYHIAKKASVDLSLPLFFLGYSLGALLGQSIMALPATSASFDRQVLFAPATALRRRAYFVKLFFLFGKRLKLPSYAPGNYRVHRSLPLHVYEILFNEQKNVAASRFRNLNIPTLIFLDTRDELISYIRLRRQINLFALQRYKVVLLTGKLNDRKSQYHHLIIDEQSLGEENWKLVNKEMEAFLFGPLV